MIVYRDQRSRVDASVVLAQLRSSADSVAATSDFHSYAVEHLIALGILESGVCDALFPTADGIHPVARLLRRTSMAAGRALWHSWHDRLDRAHEWWQRSRHQLQRIDSAQLPSSVEVSVPEGYAYYGVYPELYLEAAKDCYARLGNISAVCLGLRSIGSSLSGAVAGALEALGCRVQSWTLRPHGHPFCRSPQLRPELRARFEETRAAHFLIIDEGPGISGSSLGGTAAMLHSLGIPDDHIVLFPSWDTDGSTLHSVAARDHWSRHRRFSRTFEQVWLESERLRRIFPGQWRDFSAGKWRGDLYPGPEHYPAVHPQHERRKYLVTSAGEQRLLSFVGLGVQARSKLQRGERIADAGFTPRPDRAAHGFMVRPFIAGSPLGAAQGSDPALLERVARYLGYLSCEHRTEPTVSDAALREMLAVNLEEGLPDWAPPTGWRLPEVQAERPVALDGRMFPHEWIRTSSGYLKVDVIDHHDDHFFPGCQDIAWDVAAVSLELGLERSARQYLLNRYHSLANDRTIAGRLPHYAVAYLAFRLGYVTLAAQVLGESDDGLRFRGETKRYRRLLQQQLADSSLEYWRV